MALKPGYTYKVTNGKRMYFKKKADGTRGKRVSKTVALVGGGGSKPAKKSRAKKSGAKKGKRRPKLAKNQRGKMITMNGRRIYMGIGTKDGAVRPMRMTKRSGPKGKEKEVPVKMRNFPTGKAYKRDLARRAKKNFGLGPNSKVADFKRGDFMMVVDRKGKVLGYI